ncbi:BMP family ABC transporter substrate-binding protein [Salicibibacter halophilus]|uniref:BMP family ABC transporter substrate-binding protein n=1 Tax=Salicibibacter halophilus TaxID=2502791 RepID=A0A514LEZ7_9BACI|nr:BMP family ABC transporter substrate-binding protein [Salicibibacter halophilus]QDI90420.1 BMP family ABC transporter substrate-binding protein [Salicibibacter halophilus]
MMKKRSTLLLSVLLGVGTILTACGGGDDEASGEGDSAEFAAKMVADEGGIDDRSFNESAWNGLQDFEADYSESEVDYIQSDSSSDYQPNLMQFAREGTDITFGIGFLMLDDILSVSEQNPDENFALVDDIVVDENDDPVDNVASITFAEHEGSFLVGVIAALHTETDQLGYIGGVDSPLINKFEAGFRAGVEYVDPNIDVAIQYTEDFNDASLGQQVADTMYGNGADIIFHAAGGSGNGLFTEAIDRRNQDEDVWVIGVDQDQALQEEEWADVTLTSMVKRVDEAVYQVSEDTMEGNFPGGEILEFDLEDDGVGIAETRDHVSEEALEAAEEYTEMIINGEIDVPETVEEFETFADSL